MKEWLQKIENLATFGYSGNCLLYISVFVKNPGLDFDLVEEENQRGGQRNLSVPLHQGKAGTRILTQDVLDLIQENTRQEYN